MHPFVEGRFVKKFLAASAYKSNGTWPDVLTRFLPSLHFYSALLGGPLRWLCQRAAKGTRDLRDRIG